MYSKEEIRERYEEGLLDQIVYLAEDLKSFDEKGITYIYTHQRYYVSSWANVHGYLSAGVRSAILTLDEYDQLESEVQRWQYC